MLVLQALSMSGMGLSLGGAANKFKAVMSEPHGRRMVTMAGAGAVALFVLYLWLI